MARTDDHTPFVVAYTPGDIWWGPRQNVTLTGPMFRGETDMIPWHEANKHFDRPRAVREEARRMNRKTRHDARAAIVRGSLDDAWDDLTIQYSPRHAAVWNCE